MRKTSGRRLWLIALAGVLVLCFAQMALRPNLKDSYSTSNVLLPFPAEALAAPESSASNPFMDSKQKTPGEVSREPLTIPAGGNFSLLVADLAGTPIPGLRIGVQLTPPRVPYDLENPPVVGFLGETNHAGLIVLPPFTEEVISILSLDPEWLVVGPSILVSPGSSSFQVHVRPGGGVSGVVVGPNGPIAGATVGAFVTTKFFGRTDLSDPVPGLFDPSNLRFTRTNNLGQFHIGGLHPSSSKLNILADGFAPLSHRFEGPLVGEIVDVGTLKVERGVNVAFQLSSTSSLPEGMLLYLKKDKAGFTRGNSGLVVDEHKVATVDNLIPGSYKWSLERPGGVNTKGTTVVPGNGGIVGLEIPPFRPLSISVSTIDGLPISDFLIRAKEAGGRTAKFKGTDTILVQRSEDSTIRLSVTAPGFAPSPQFRVPRTETSLDIRLERPGRLQVHIVGIDEISNIRGGILLEKDRERLLLLDEGISPVSTPNLAVLNQTILFEDIPPGNTWVIFDLGAGPSAHGPFQVSAEQTKSVEINVPLPRRVEGFVFDSTDGNPVPAVSIRVSSTPGAGLSQLIAPFAPEELEDAQSDAKGKFEVIVPQNKKRYLSFSSSNYEPAAAEIDPEFDGPLQIKLVPLPSTTLDVAFTPSHPAAHANISFLRRSSGSIMPESLGSVRLDRNGHARLETVSSGVFDATINYDFETGVRYSIEAAQVEVENGLPIHLVLIESPGWLSIQATLHETFDEVLIQSALALDSGGAKVICDQAWLRGLSGPLPLPPGEYRITGRTGKLNHYASCSVKAGESTSVSWEEANGQIFVEILGSNWTTSSLKIKLLDGSLAGLTRTVQFDRTPDPLLINNLPKGQYQISLIEWADVAGIVKRPNWSIITDVVNIPANITFNLNSATSVEFHAIDEDGNSLRNVTLSCVVNESKIVTGVTDREGRAKLFLPNDGVAILARRHDLASAVIFLESLSDAEVEFVIATGGSLMLEVEDLREVGGEVQISLLPDSPFAQPLKTALLGTALRALTVVYEAASSNGEVVINRIPPGRYQATAVGKDGMSWTTSVTVVSERQALAILTLAD